MRVTSFDVFDTLLTRLVAHPHDIFLELGADLKHQRFISCTALEFATLRTGAEREAGERLSHPDVSLSEIYTVLSERFGWDSQQTIEAMNSETAVERRSVRSNPGAVGRVARARLISDQIVFISDMYLPPEVIHSLLRDLGFFQPGDKLFVSNAVSGSKASGKLYQFIRGELSNPSDWSHFGDNNYSDCVRAGESGIKAELVSDCSLSRYEQVFRPLGVDSLGPLWRSKVAGIMRLARLSGFDLETSHERTIWNTGTQVVGPLLFGFVFWVLREAQSRGLQRLYFIARDGQILQRLARIIAPAAGIEIDCRYLFGSRQAWRLAALGDFDEVARKWILPAADRATLRTAFTRAGLDPNHFVNELERAGFNQRTWNELLDTDEKERLWILFGALKLDEKIRENSVSARHNLCQYLRQEGFFDGTPLGIVDIGWHGNLQQSLRRAVDLQLGANQTKLAGLYFGLVDDFEMPNGDCAAAFWPMQRARDPFKTEKLTLLEVFTAADHGSVIGYENKSTGVVPVLQSEKNDAAIEWGLPALQESILAFAKLMVAEFPLSELPLIEYSEACRQVYRLFISRPERSEALTWGSFPFGNQANEVVRDFLVTDWSEWKNLTALLDHSRRPTAWWLEGTLKRRFSPSLYLFLVARRIREKYRRQTSNVWGQPESKIKIQNERQ